MPLEVFVDESVRRTYVLCAVRVDPRDLAAARSAVRALLLRGERRIHFSKESDRRRRELLARLCDHGFDVALYSAPAHDRTARAGLVALLVDDLGDELHRLVFESRNAGDVDDQRQLIDLHRTGHFPDHATYEHLRPHEEPLLWVADAVAWAHGAGGDWPRHIAPMIRIVRQHEA
jgi:hypothetical protein